MRQVSGPGLGRRVSTRDAPNESYALSRRAHAAGVVQKHWSTPAPFDQGATSQCVAYAGVRYLVSGPVRNLPVNFEALYRECLRNDEWEGEDVEGGTSVGALFKVLKARGVVSEYRWGFDAETVVDHLLTKGPVVMGTLWSDEMANVGSDGYLTVGNLARARDGHSWCATGANRRRRNPDRSWGAVRSPNSWGPRWGDGGRFWVSFGDLDKLIKADGEACVAMEVKLAALEAAFGDNSTMMA